MSLQTLVEDAHIYLSTKIQFFLKPRKLVSANVSVFTVHVIDKYVCISKYIYTIVVFNFTCSYFNIITIIFFMLNVFLVVICYIYLAVFVRNCFGFFSYRLGYI